MMLFVKLGFYLTALLFTQQTFIEGLLHAGHCSLFKHTVLLTISVLPLSVLGCSPALLDLFTFVASFTYLLYRSSMDTGATHT